MKKIFGWGAGMLVLIAIVSGSSTSNTNSNNQVTPAAQPVADTVQAEVAPAKVVEPEPVTPAPVLVEAAPNPKPAAASSNCDSNYSPCVPNVSYDLDCGDISFSVTVLGSDPHRFDRDGDGYGCESN